MIDKIVCAEFLKCFIKFGTLNQRNQRINDHRQEKEFDHLVDEVKTSHVHFENLELSPLDRVPQSADQNSQEIQKVNFDVVFGTGPFGRKTRI